MKRLERVLNLIPKNTKIMVDVGTDHGFLAIRAILEKKVKYVIASDINQKPLSNARKNVRKFHLENEILLILNDGLDFLDLTFFQTMKIDLCVIAGMGDITIKNILEKKSHHITNYIICSNNQPSHMRKLINQKKWSLFYEDFFYDKNKPYWIMFFGQKETKISISNELLGDFNWYQNNQEYYHYLVKQKKYYETILSGIKKAEKTQLIKAHITKLTIFIKKWGEKWN